MHPKRCSSGALRCRHTSRDDTGCAPRLGMGEHRNDEAFGRGPAKTPASGLEGSATGPNGRIAPSAESVIAGDPALGS
jgi:hypothetical protein